MTLPTANPTDHAPLPADPTTERNGSASPLPSRLPRARRWSRRTQVLLAAGLVLAVTITGSIAWSVRSSSSRNGRADLVTYRVRPEKLELTIIERGALESARNSDIYCTVKSGAKNSTIATTIKSVIEDGSSVQRGDLVIDLDDSGLQEQLKTQKIIVDRAEADRIKAEEDYKIQLSQNESDIKTAEVKLELAQIDLQKYKEGDYPQQLKIFEGNIKQAESDMEQQRDRVSWANRMVKKGYLTVTQAQGEQSKLDSLNIILSKATEDRRVLTDPIFGTGKRMVTSLQNDVAEARRALDRFKSQAAAKDVQFRSARETTKSVFLQERSRYKEIEDEIKKCKIFAPQDGMVVYYVPEQARGGSGSQQSIVAQGEPVREGQKLMQIPDLRQMLVNTKVHEALVSRVHPGQPALIRVDSFPDRLLQGHVETVATVSAQQDWMSADVKVYTTKVMIDESVPGLKPGMSAEVTITVADALTDVLTVPVQAILGSSDMGKKRKCYVMTPEGPEERDILIGQSNDRMAEIQEGLSEGDEVVLNPRAVSGDNATKPVPRGRRGDTGAGKTAGSKNKPPAKKDSAPKPGTPTTAPTPEDRRQQQQLLEQFRPASPLQRRQMLEQLPTAAQYKVKQQLKAEGIDLN